MPNRGIGPRAQGRWNSQPPAVTGRSPWPPLPASFASSHHRVPGNTAKSGPMSAFRLGPLFCVLPLPKLRSWVDRGTKDQAQVRDQRQVGLGGLAPVVLRTPVVVEPNCALQDSYLVDQPTLRLHRPVPGRPAVTKAARVNSDCSAFFVYKYIQPVCIF